MYHVLYVDDDPNLLDVARFFLEATGEIELDTARFATEALRRPGLAALDAIIADYEMPRMDGIAFLKRVRADHGDIPFILFTGKGREHVVIEAFNNGADFYLQKGGDPKSQFADLAHALKNAIERRQTLSALKESERKYRNLYTHAQVGLFETHLSCATIIACNRKYCDLFGFSSVEDAIGKDVLSLYARPEDRDEVTRRLHEDGYIDDHEAVFVNRRTGQNFAARFSARIDRENDIAEGTIIDITERKVAEANLLHSEEAFGSLMRESTDGIMLIDEGGTVIEWNPALEHITGISRNDAAGSPLMTVFSRILAPSDNGPDYLDRIGKDLETALRTGSSSYFSHRISTKILRPDGSRHAVQQVSFPIRTSRGFRIGSIIREIPVMT